MTDMQYAYEQISKRVRYRSDGLLFWENPINRNDVTGREVGCFDRGGYRFCRFMGRTILTHRLVFFIHHGFLPKAVDHINRVRSDNRIENLRACTTAEQNPRNAGKKQGFTSKYKGVSWAKTKGKWRASANKDGKSKYLGCFDDEKEAARAYNSFVIKHYGEFAAPNTIE